MNELDFKKLNFSIFGRNCEVEGNLKLHGDTLISSNLKGTITMIDNGKLTIERDSFINGDIYCNDVEIFGKFEGSIKASGTLIVRSSAIVSGNIQAKRISIYPGAILNIEGHTPEQELSH